MRKSGIFSRINLFQEEALKTLIAGRILSSGQKSNKSSRKGSVTTIGFASRARAKKNSDQM